MKPGNYGALLWHNTLYTTKKLLRENGACPSRYRVLLRHLGPGYPDDKPIPLTVVLESNGQADTLWCLKAVPPEQEAQRDHLIHELACDYADHVRHLYEAAYPGDLQSEAYMVMRLYAEHHISFEDVLGWEAQWLREQLDKG